MHIGQFWPNELENRAIFDDFALHEFENRVNFYDFAQLRLKIVPLFIIAIKVYQGGSEHVEGRLCYEFFNYFSRAF